MTVTTATTATERRELLRTELEDRTMYLLLGGEAGIRAIVDHFYDAMDADARFAPIRTMHALDLEPMRQGLFEFLSGWLGGPQLFATRTGSVCLSHAHAPFTIDATARDLWLECFDGAMAASGVELRYREALAPALGHMAEMLRNTD